MTVPRFPRGNRGVTLVELILVMVVMTVLAGVAMPMYTVSVKRAKEYKLNRALREMRDAIDEYKRWDNNGWVSHTTTSGYPQTLEILVSGVATTGVAVAPGTTRSVPPGTLPSNISFLREIPVDPMTGSATWGTKSNMDVATGSGISGGQDVYDVYSLSDETALDGTNYSDW